MTTARSLPTGLWEGMELPGYVIAISFERIAMTPLATWDFFPGHHNPDFARAQGQRSIYLNTGALQGFADRLVTDWAGPGTFIARRKLWMRASVYPGDMLSVGGKIVRVGCREEHRRVDLAIWLRTETATACDVETTAILDFNSPPQRHSF